tara:strand:+ start:5102 stop:5608 length:507 start_codon:yes stop_codon:yes gene_type:complete
MDWDKGHSTFVNQLKKGYDYQLQVKKILEDKGLNVHIDSLRIRPKNKKINNYTDKGDLFIKTDKHIFNIEVKSISVAYNNIYDFPYENIIVDMVENWDKKKHNVSAIINISQKTNATFVIPVSQKDNWFVQSRFDKIKKYTKDFYFIEKKYIKTLDDFVFWVKNLNIE